MFLEATSEIASRITTAIRDAARATGASFDYLLRTAQRESNLDPTAKAPTSSASGLFQFTDQTWLETLKTSGPALGYGNYADSIVQTASGQFTVPDPARRQAVMQLRNDPAAASAMAGALTRRNATILAERIGRPPSDGELYAAHFLGAGGAARLIAMNAAAPQTKVADIFPVAARANPAIFYDAHGNARNASQVYALLTAPSGKPNVPSPAGETPAAFTAPLTVASATSSEATETNRNRYAGESGPVFHNLFSTERNGPVSPFVSQLWGSGSAQYPVQLNSGNQAAAPLSTAVAGTRPLDLHDFQRPAIPTVGGSTS